MITTIINQQDIEIFKSEETYFPAWTFPRGIFPKYVIDIVQLHF